MTPFATFDVWRVPTQRVPWAATRIVADRQALRTMPGLRFAKLLGTGSGQTFTMRGADLHRWALFAVWESAAEARAGEASPAMRAWARVAEERWRLELLPLRARGLWSRRRPFSPCGPGPPTCGPGPPTARVEDDPAAFGHRDLGSAAAREKAAAPLAVLTRARLTVRGARRFWRAVPPVAGDLDACPGLRFAIGFGEAPLVTLGTLSVWDDAAAMTDFAYRHRPHREVVRRTADVGWYAEALFARFAVLGAHGTVGGVEPLMWVR